MTRLRIHSVHRLVLMLPLCLGLGGCDKIKEVAEDVSSKVSGELEERLEESEDENKNNPLMALVDKNEDGAVFRKDLEFPTKLRVETSYKRKISGRIFHESELGRNIEAVEGKESTTAEFVREGSTVVYSLKESSFELPVPENAEGEQAKPTTTKNPFHEAPPLSKPMTFLRTQDGWKGKTGGDFKMMAMNQALSPVFEDMLIENAVLPRPLWFSSSRIKVGDEITVSGAALPMLIAGKAQGSLTLKLEGFEEVKGHPCGRFSVSGEFSRNNFPNLEGRLLDQEVSVESGELWLSLLFPMILKEKIQTIQTFKPSDGGSTIGRGQGTIDTLVVREWHADIPLPEPDPEPASAEQPPEQQAPQDESEAESGA